MTFRDWTSKIQNA